MNMQDHISTIVPPPTTPNVTATLDTHFVIGSRKSQLALIQTHHVRDLLLQRGKGLKLDVESMSTTGDVQLDRALSAMGAKSLFTKELEVALEAKSVDFVVHSLKDLPTTLPDGMTVAAMTTREDPRDAVIMSIRNKDKKLRDLPAGSVIGTSSVRRMAQLKAKFPALEFQDIRGNLNTRLKKLDDEQGPYAALLLAHAGVHRMGWDDRISETLEPEVMLHAVGQGALGIECREGDARVLKLLVSLDDYQTRIRCSAERNFMRELEGGCSVPLGVFTSIHEGVLSMTGAVFSLDGTQEIKDHSSIPLTGERQADVLLAEELGRRLALSVEARGGKELLDIIKADKRKLLEELEIADALKNAGVVEQVVKVIE